MSTFRPLPDGHTYAVTGMKRDAITGLYTTERKPRMHTWPDAHIVLQDVINAAPDYSIPFAVHVFVFDTVDHLREACGDPKASAHSTTYDQPDDAGIGAIVMLAETELSLVAHEATHIALHHHGNEAGKGSAKTWLAHHPESIAEMIGNLTALIWYRVAS